MTPTTLQLIKFFARFPGDINNVLFHFKQDCSSLPATQLATYEALKTELGQMPIKNLIPELKGFYFGSDPDDIIEYIKNAPMPFIFVLYPDKNFGGTHYNIEGKYEVIISILHENNQRNRDSFARAVIDDLCESISFKIKDYILYDETDCALIRAIDTNSINQIYDKAFGCTGWTTVLHFNF